MFIDSYFIQIIFLGALGPNFKLDSKDMEDIFSGMIDDEESKDGAESSVTSEASSKVVDASQQQQPMVPNSNNQRSSTAHASGPQQH